MFPCVKCGSCCRKAWLSNGILPLKESGECLHLMGDDLCEIYEDRPEICKVKEGNYKLNANICNLFIEDDIKSGILPKDYKERVVIV